MGEVGCLASISCGSRLPSERDISYENMHADFSKLLPAPLQQKGRILTAWVFSKNRSTPAIQVILVEMREESHPILQFGWRFPVEIFDRKKVKCLMRKDVSQKVSALLAAWNWRFKKWQNHQKGSYNLGVKFFLLYSTESTFPLGEGSQTSPPRCLSLKRYRYFTKAVFSLFLLFFFFPMENGSFMDLTLQQLTRAYKSHSEVLAKTKSNFDKCLCDLS